MKSVFVLFLITLNVLLNTVIAQDSTKTIETPFTKGRSIVALGGNINSGTSGTIGLVSDSKKFINQYSFDINLSKVASRNFIIGMKLSTERTETDQLVDSQTEILTVGPISRVYMSTTDKG